MICMCLHFYTGPSKEQEGGQIFGKLNNLQSSIISGA